MLKNKTYIVEYTNEDMVGNQVLTMQVEADSLDEAYAMMDWTYPNLTVDTIYPAGAGYADL